MIYRVLLFLSLFATVASSLAAEKKAKRHGVLAAHTSHKHRHTTKYHSDSDDPLLGKTELLEGGWKNLKRTGVHNEVRCGKEYVTGMHTQYRFVCEIDKFFNDADNARYEIYISTDGEFITF